jgi:hypothetical protein
MFRLPKKSALDFAQKWTPLLAEAFHFLQIAGGRVKVASRYASIRQNVAGYVLLYDDERKLGMTTLYAVLGEEGIKELNHQAALFSAQEAAEFLEGIAGEEGENFLGEVLDFPDTEEEWEEQERLFQALPAAEKEAAAKRSQWLFSCIFGQLFNILALMTHGAKLTVLVPQALQGDDDAFLKAVQVDRLLLTHHPYFIQRKQQAQDNGEAKFLHALAYRENNPNLKGKIRYPALFMLFGVLEAVQWLNDLRHEEILDLCDEIGLDRFQNRIEDVTYLTKRLEDYRRFQKSSGMSMH